jgi:hypothetical protein
MRRGFPGLSIPAARSGEGSSGRLSPPPQALPKPSITAKGHLLTLRRRRELSPRFGSSRRSLSRTPRSTQKEPWADREGGVAQARKPSLNATAGRTARARHAPPRGGLYAETLLGEPGSQHRRSLGGPLLHFLHVLTSVALPVRDRLRQEPGDAARSVQVHDGGILRIRRDDPLREVLPHLPEELVQVPGLSSSDDHCRLTRGDRLFVAQSLEQESFNDIVSIGAAPIGTSDRSWRRRRSLRPRRCSRFRRLCHRCLVLRWRCSTGSSHEVRRTSRTRSRRRCASSSGGTPEKTG